MQVNLNLKFNLFLKLIKPNLGIRFKISNIKYNKSIQKLI